MNGELRSRVMALELVHSHIARIPISLATMIGDVPKQVSRIVTHLLP